MDRRYKLNERQRDDVLALKGKETMVAVAAMFSVSRRTIEFIWYPERKEANRKMAAAKGGWRRHYDKERSRKNNLLYRQRKRERGEGA